MRLINCESPRYIISPHNGETIACRCGVCNSCRNEFAHRWTRRLDLESQCHKYTFMVTLTYEDRYLPSLFFSDDMEYLVLNRDSSVRIPLKDVFEACKEEGEYDDTSLIYLRDRLIHPLGLPVIYTKDATNFFKRFNKYCFKHITHHYENFRYFCCHEYGPSVYRPHMHLLLWFDDDKIANRFTEILCSCWTFGNCTGESVFSNGAHSYVSQYVNMSLHLPTFYKLDFFRQNHQFSKCPPIGSLSILDKEISGLYERAITKRTIWNSRSSKYDVVPLDSSIKSRYFPKCFEYSQLSHSDRVRLYSAVEYFPSETFQEFRHSADLIKWLSYRNIANDTERFFCSVFRKIEINSVSSDTFENSLKRMYTVSKRIVWISRILRTSVDYIVKRIEEFWFNVDYDNLCSMYEKQAEYLDPPLQNSVSDLVYMYPDFYKALPFYLSSVKRPLYFNYALDSLDIHSLDDIPSFDQVKDFLQMRGQAEKIYKDTHKRHFCNAYRDGLLADHDLKLSKIIRKYQLNLYGET